MRKMSLGETQQAAKEVLRGLDEICQELGIQYWLIWGTLLGAVRHKGFIPWDDDIDIGMYLSDFQKLKEYFLSHPDMDLEFHDRTTKPECFYNIARITDKKHHLVFDNMKYVSGVFVDVYPFVGLGNEEDLTYWQELFAKHNRWRKGIYICSSSTLLYGNSTAHKIMNLPIVILDKLRGKQYYFQLFNQYKHMDLDNSTFIGTPCWEDYILEKRCFERFVRVPFEDIKVYIPEDYDTILKALYNDYMKLPDEKYRHPKHGYVAYEI